MEMRSEPTVYHVAKTIAVLLVIIAHCTVMYTSYGAFDPLNDSPVLAVFTDYIYSFHMPLFVFLSGAIYSYGVDHGKYSEFFPFLFNKAKRLLVPYFVFGFFYVAPTMCLLGLTEQTFFEYCYSGILLSQNSRHLWYLPALFWIFLLVMPAKPLFVKSTKIRIALLLCSHLLFYIASYVPGKFQLYACCQYLFYFLLGVSFHYEYVHFYNLAQKYRYLYFPLPLVLFVQFRFNPNLYTHLFYRLIGITMILGLALYITQRKPHLLKNPYYLLIQNHSFGIYLFHPMIIYVLYFFLGKYDIPPFILSFGIFIATSILSILATKLLRRFHLEKLIGE